MLFIWANFALREGQLERERERGGVVRAKGKQRLGDALVLSFILFYFPLDFPSARRMPPLTLISPWAKVLLYFFLGNILNMAKCNGLQMFYNWQGHSHGLAFSFRFQPQAQHSTT